MIFYIAIIISVVIIAMYVICLINALKHYGWLISASVMFGIDILFLFFISFMTNTLTANAVDIIIHIVALVIFISGAVASVQKIKLEKEEATQAANTSAQITGEAENNAATAVSTDAETVETDAETVEVKAETGEASQSNNESSDIN